MKRGLLLLPLHIVLSLLIQGGSIHRSPIWWAERPNIVLIETDDQRWDTLCGIPGTLEKICAGDEHPMPTVEKELVAKGVVFTNAFVTHPACCPSRASQLSGGFYSHNTNVLANGPPNGGATKFYDKVTMATLLKEQGYRTALIGKYLNHYKALVDRDHGQAHIPPGWDIFVASYEHEKWNEFGFVDYDSRSGAVNFADIAFDFQTGTGTYITDFEGQRAVNFIRRSCEIDCTQPFFLFLSTHAPHKPATPHPRHQGLFQGFTPRAKGWAEGVEVPCDEDGEATDALLKAVSDKPRYVRDHAAHTFCSHYNHTDDFDHFAGDQLRSLRAVDEAIGSIIDAVEKSGVLDRTVFIFTSDNGMMWGENAVHKKLKPYEPSIRVPLIVAGLPTPASLGRVVDRMVAIDLDVPSTILALAGDQAAAQASDGMSLLPLILDPNADWREELVLERFEGSHHAPGWAAIRTPGWKYVEYVTGEKELYDLKSDPYELESQHANQDKRYVDKIRELSEKLGPRKGLAITTENLPDPYDPHLPDGTAGEAYEFEIGVWGGNPPYTWGVFIDGNKCRSGLPRWLSLDADSGRLSGIPRLPRGRQAKTWSFCIRVEDRSDSPQPGNDRPQSYVKKFKIRVHDSLEAQRLQRNGPRTLVSPTLASLYPARHLQRLLPAQSITE